MLRIGILGCGKIAQVRHIPEYSDNPNCELIGYFNPTRCRAEDMATKYGGKVYDTAEELLNDSEIDAVSVCAANYAHAQLTIKALKAGKHVLCEKPMAMTLADCEEMVKVSKEEGKLLMIGQNQRLTKAHELARKMIEDGEIGKALTFHTKFCHSGPETWAIKPGKDTWFFDKSKCAMGVMGDLGIHKTDLIQFLLGQKVVRTTAKLVTLDKRGADGNLIDVNDNAICIYEMSDGVVGTMTASWTYYAAGDNSTVIYGTEGELRIYDGSAHSIVLKKPSQEPKYFDVEEIQTNGSPTKSGVIDLWVDCLLKGEDSPISGESVLSAMRVVFASMESSEKGVAVNIPANR